MKIAFLIFLLSTFLPGLAQANCFTECMTIAGCSGIGSDQGSFCSSSSTRCAIECGSGTNGKSYGAIAYSAPDEGYGFSDGQRDEKQAEKLALQYCRKYGKKCESMVWFYNSCGAVAADGKKTGWAHDESSPRAQELALQACRKKGGKNCRVQVSHCSR